MRPRRAALLTPPPLIPAFLQNVANSCICHTSEKSPVTPIIATDPKMRSCKSCVCHTYDPLPPSSIASPSPLPSLATSHSPLPSSLARGRKFAPLFSGSCRMLPPQPFSFHAFASLRGGGRGQTQKACSRPHNVLFQESLQSRHLCSPHPAQPRAGILVFPTSHQSRITSHRSCSGIRSPLVTRHSPLPPSRMRTYGKRWGEGGAPFSNGLRSRVTTCFTR